MPGYVNASLAHFQSVMQIDPQSSQSSLCGLQAIWKGPRYAHDQNVQRHYNRSIVHDDLPSVGTHSQPAQHYCAVGRPSLTYQGPFPLWSELWYYIKCNLPKRYLV